MYHFTGSFSIMMLQMKMAKSKFKFIITFKQAVFEENWNYFSKIKTQQDIETRKGGSNKDLKVCFVGEKRARVTEWDCTSVWRKAFPVCISFSTWNPAEV